MSRIAILSFFQETNSFNPLPTDRDASRAGLIPPGETRARFGGTQTEIGGALDVLDAARSALTCLPSFRLLPGGPLTAEALAWYGQELETAVRALSPPPDAILAILHGCTASADEPDATGWILERLHAAAGNIPIVATADFHANMTDRMLSNLASVVGYHTSPHTDLHATGQRAARELLRLLDHPGAGAPGPCAAPVCIRLPLIVPTETSMHDIAPLREVWERLVAIEDRTDRPASCFCPHPWLDVPASAVTLLAYCRAEERPETQAALQETAAALWESRDLLYGPMPDLAAAWARAASSAERPVLLVDSGDVVLAGAPGDSTALLKFLSEHETSLRCLLHVTAPAAVTLLYDQPPQNEVTVEIGLLEGEAGPSRKTRMRSSGAAPHPIRINATLSTAADTPYTATGPYEGGVTVVPGRRVALDWRGHTLVLAERRDPAHDPAFWLSLGLDPRDYDVVVIKSHNTFRPAYAAISTCIVRAATPGATNRNLHELPYKGGNRDLYPLASPPAPKWGKGAVQSRSE